MDSDDTKEKVQKLGFLIFESVMAFAYIAFGYVLLFTPLLNDRIQGGLRIGLGVILGLYGLFRVYQAYRKITLKNE